MCIKIWDGFLTWQSPVPGSREDSPAWDQAVLRVGDRDTPMGFLGRALSSAQPLQSRFQCRGGISLPSTTSWYWEGTGEPEGNWWDWCGLDWAGVGGAAGSELGWICLKGRARGPGHHSAAAFHGNVQKFLFLILVLHQIRLEWAGGIPQADSWTDRQTDRECDCSSHTSLGNQAENKQNPVLSCKQLQLTQTETFPVKKKKSVLLENSQLLLLEGGREH